MQVTTRRIVVTTVVACVAFLGVSVPGAAAAPKRITDELSKRGYDVIAVAANGRAASARARPRFKLRPPAGRVTMHLRAGDGTYAGPIVLAKQRRGKRAILGVRAGAKLRQVKVNRRRGYARAKRVHKRSIDEKRWARARKGIPNGAGNFGRVRSKRTRGGVPGDLDLDGIPDDLDIDNDGDLILDPVDPSPSRRAALATATPNDFDVHPVLPVLTEYSASSNAGSSDAEIEAALPTLGRLGIDLLAPGAELDCGGAPDPANPGGWIGGLSYCTRGGSGSVWGAGEGDDRGGGPPFPGPAGGTYDADGDGFGALDAFGSGWQLHHGARPRHPAHDPSISQIGSGDVLVQRVTSGGPEGECGSANTSCFTSTVPFVFATAQALNFYDDGAGNSAMVGYPIAPGDPGTPENPFPVAAGAGGEVKVSLTFWRPQRRPASEDECASPQPGCTSSEWIDIGALRYLAAVGDPPGAPAIPLGKDCPSSAYTIPDGQELAPSFPEDDPSVGGLVDQAPDRPANPQNTFTYALNLTQCLHGEAWSSGEDVGVGFSAVTNSTGTTGMSVYFRLE